ncbi:hypothetical protein CIB48_g6647 [Xylaria polymorpha]|nr:hypothetical protein CIB48_g6647 [Xylaria polymorpha]
MAVSRIASGRESLLPTVPVWHGVEAEGDGECQGPGQDKAVDEALRTEPQSLQGTGESGCYDVESVSKDDDDYRIIMGLARERMASVGSGTTAHWVEAKESIFTIYISDKETE